MFFATRFSWLRTSGGVGLSLIGDSYLVSFGDALHAVYAGRVSNSESRLIDTQRCSSDPPNRSGRWTADLLSLLGGTSTPHALSHGKACPANLRLSLRIMYKLSGLQDCGNGTVFSHGGDRRLIGGRQLRTKRRSLPPVICGPGGWLCSWLWVGR